MLKITMSDGCVLYCDICQTPILEITDALGIHRPLNGPMDHADVLVIHASCRASSLVKMLLPTHVKRPLVELLAQADEAVNR